MDYRFNLENTGYSLKKNKTLNLRVSKEFKIALRLASNQERRSMGNMIEKLVFDYCKQKKLMDRVKKISKEENDSV
jgi:hypothetical protein